MTVTSANWNHFAVSVTGDDPTTADAYLNGQALSVKQTVSSGSASAKGNLIVARAGGAYFDGTMDEMQIYNRELSASEILNHYTASKKTYITVAPGAGLVGHWLLAEQDFDGTDQIYDKAGSNDGTGTNIASGDFVAGYDGRDNTSIDFDGSSEFISINAPTIDPTNAAISFWAKKDADGFVFGNAAQSSKHSVRFSGGTLIIESTGSAQRANGTLNSDDTTNWHHYVISMSSDVASMYQDNVALTMNDSSIADNVTPNRIGVNLGSIYFNGLLQDVRIYNRTLSATEVSDLYNASKRISALEYDTPWLALLDQRNFFQKYPMLAALEGKAYSPEYPVISYETIH